VTARSKIPTNDAGCGQHDAAEITGVCKLLNIVIAELKRGMEFGVEA
jgi:hypothetical protein